MIPAGRLAASASFLGGGLVFGMGAPAVVVHALGWANAGVRVLSAQWAWAWAGVEALSSLLFFLPRTLAAPVSAWMSAGAQLFDNAGATLQATAIGLTVGSGLLMSVLLVGVAWALERQVHGRHSPPKVMDPVATQRSSRGVQARAKAQ